VANELEFGSRDRAVIYPSLMNVGPYIGKTFPEVSANFIGKKIYHYTTSDGLIGILQNSSIWASNYAFMNDPSEITYSINKSKEAIDIARKGRGKIAMNMFDKLNSELDKEGSWTEYIASFCEDGDLLSQWRTYAAGASGYSIEFDADVLNWNLINTVGLYKVIYDPKLQIEILTEVCDIIADFIENSFSTNGDTVNMLLDDYASEFVIIFRYLCSRMKHEAYSEEKEWRLVYLKSSSDEKAPRLLDKKVHFRTRGSMIVPYVNIPFDKEITTHKERYPVRRIIIGPTEHTGIAIKGVELLCGSIHKDITIVSSSIPAR